MSGPQPVLTFVRLKMDDMGSTPCCEIKNGGKGIELKRAGERERGFDKIFDMGDDDSSVASAVGGHVAEVVQNGLPGGIVMFGPTGSGKTHNFMAIVKYMAGEVVKGATPIRCVLIHHDQVLDLLNTANDNLKLKFDEAKNETTPEGATVENKSSADEVLNLVKQCQGKAEEWQKTKGSNPMVCCTVLWIGNLIIVDCAGSERVFKVGMTPEEKAEGVTKTKVLNMLMSMGSQVGKCEDPKAVPWKDCKLTRILQGPMSSAMDGKGRFSWLFCVVNGQRCIAETTCTLNVAEPCVRLEGLKTVGEYKEMISYYEERMEGLAGEAKRVAAEASKEEAATAKVKADYDAKVAELAGKSQAVELRVNQAKKKVEMDKANIEKEYEKKREEVKKKCLEELEKLKNLSKNAGSTIDAEVTKKTSEVEQQMAEFDRTSAAELSKLENEADEFKMHIEIHAEKVKAREQAEKEAMAPIKEEEKIISKLMKDLETAGVSREEGKTDEELAQLRPMWEIRDKLDDLEEKLRPLRIKCLRYEWAKANALGKPESDEESGSGSGSDSGSGSGEDSEDEDEKKEREAEELKKKQEELLKMQKEAFEREKKQFFAIEKKEAHLKDLLEQIVQYLEYGCSMRNVQTTIAKNFIFLGKDRSQIFVCDMDQNGVPNRKQFADVIPVDSITDIKLGQSSDQFKALLAQSPHGKKIVSRGDTPPDCDALTVTSLPFFFYRSLTLICEEGKILNIIMESSTDFEAWVVALHKLTNVEPQWGRDLPIETMDGYKNLLENEREMAKHNHIIPAMYTVAKEAILMHDRLYITLYDVRTLSNLDMFHSQKMFDFFIKQKWIERHVMYYLKVEEVEAHKAKIKAVAPGGKGGKAAPGGKGPGGKAPPGGKGPAKAPGGAAPKAPGAAPGKAPVAL
eukprot:PhF_6_TR10027/c0_g1_i1/m.15363